MRKAAVAAMTVLILLAASFLALATPVSGAAASENTWVSKAPMNEARAYLGVVAVNGKNLCYRRRPRASDGKRHECTWYDSRSDQRH